MGVTSPGTISTPRRAPAGDLHLDSREMELFFEARAHLRGALTSTRVRAPVAEPGPTPGTLSNV